MAHKQRSLLSVVGLLCFTATTAVADHELLNRDLKAGEAVYANQCASCHGINLQGDPTWRIPYADGSFPPPPHDETGHSWHHDNQMLFAYTKKGGQEALTDMGITNFKSGMPAFKDVLTDEEIWEVLAFIRSTWPEQAKAVQAARNPKHD